MVILSGFLKISRPTEVVSSAAPTDFGVYEVIRRNQGGGALAVHRNSNRNGLFVAGSACPDQPLVQHGRCGLDDALRCRRWQRNLLVLFLRDVRYCQHVSHRLVRLERTWTEGLNRFTSTQLRRRHVLGSFVRNSNHESDARATYTSPSRATCTSPIRATCTRPVRAEPNR